MEMYERIRELRKSYLKMSQTDFGEALGVSRSVIKNIELNALARPDQKLSLIKLICKEFNVNEEWLLNGSEPMIIEPDVFSLDDFVKSHGMTDFELEIVKTYFELDPDIRTTLVNHFRSKLAPTAAAEVNTAATADTVEDAEAAYIKSRLDTAQNTGLSASSLGAGIDANKASNE